MPAPDGPGDQILANINDCSWTTVDLTDHRLVSPRPGAAYSHKGQISERGEMINIACMSGKKKSKEMCAFFFFKILTFEHRKSIAGKCEC